MLELLSISGDNIRQHPLKLFFRGKNPPEEIFPHPVVFPGNGPCLEAAWNEQAEDEAECQQDFPHADFL